MKYVFYFMVFLVVGFMQAQSQWTLEQCITYAQENNLDLENSQMSEKIYALQEQMSKNEKLPQVNGRFNNSLNFGFQPTALGLYIYNQSYSNNWGVDANMVLYNKGNLRLQNQKASLSTQIQELNSSVISQNMALQIANLYLQILLNKELLIISEKQLENTENQLDKIQKLFNAGSIPFADLVEQQARKASDNSQMENSKINVNRALFQLAIFLQIKEYEAFKIVEVQLPEELEFNELSVQDIIDYALTNRPEIKKAELQVESAEKDVEIAKTSLYPSINGGYSLGTSYYDFFDTRGDKMFQQWYDNHNQQLYVGINIPIFNKHNNKLNIENAQLNKDLIAQNIEREKLQLTQDIQTAYFDAQSAYQSFQNLKIAYEAAQTSESYGEKSFQAGRTTIYDFNTLKTNTNTALSQMIQAKYEYYFRLKVLDFYAGRPIEIEYQ